MGAEFGGLTSRVLADRLTFERWLYPVEPGGKEEKAIRLAWRSSSKPVRRLLKAEFDRDRISAWSKTRIVLVASKTP